MMLVTNALSQDVTLLAFVPNSAGTAPTNFYRDASR